MATKEMICRVYKQRFHYDFDQVRVTCPLCGAVQNAKPDKRLSAQEAETVKDRQCGDKRRFLDFDTADHIRVDYERQHQREMNCYKCEHCGFWHIGHKRTTRQAIVPTDFQPITGIDYDLPIEEVAKEIDILKLDIMNRMAELARTDKLNPRRRAMVQALIYNQTRAAQLKAVANAWVREQKKAKPKPVNRFANADLEELIDVFMQSARQICKLLRDHDQEAKDRLAADSGMLEIA